MAAEPDEPVQPAAPEPAAAELPDEVMRPRSRWRWLRRAAVALALLVVAGVVAAIVAFEPVARWYVMDQAARRGVRLTPREMTVAWGRASFFDVVVELDGVPDLALEADWLEVRADGLVPREAVARGVTARARTADAVRQVLAFGREHADDLLPARATDVHLALGVPGAAVLDARVAEAELPAEGPVRAGGVTIDVPRPRLVIGPVALVVAARGGALDVRLGEDPATAPLRVVADLDARSLTVELSRTPAATLATWLGRPASAGPPPWPADLAVAGRGEARWAADPTGDLTGTIDATLLGLVPPHPPELAGIVFGDHTQVSLAFRARSADAAVDLPRLEVAAGSLRLAGTGSLVPRGDTFTASAQLRGTIPCADLVGSAAVAHLGLSLGSGLGTLAQHGLAGSVDVRLALAIDGQRPMQPDVRPSATIHCRLRLPGL